jgi:hypothetical protein
MTGEGRSPAGVTISKARCSPWAPGVAILGRRPVPRPPTRLVGTHPSALNHEDGTISRTPPSRCQRPPIDRAARVAPVRLP